MRAIEVGLLSVTGTPETPSRVGISVADIAGGMYAFSGVLAALYERERTGRGELLAVIEEESLSSHRKARVRATKLEDAMDLCMPVRCHGARSGLEGHSAKLALHDARRQH